MVWVATAILAALCVVLLVHGFLVRGRSYAFPFFAAVMFLTFVLPQLPGLVNDYFIPKDTLAYAILFCAACLAACHVGWEIGVRHEWRWNVAFNEKRLLQAAGFLSLVGAYFFHKFGQLPDDERLIGFLSGAAVAYLFFAKLLTYGLAIAVLCCARRVSGPALAIIAFDCLFYFDRIVIAGRRGDLAEFCMLFALALWFQRRWAVPRPAVVGGILLAMAGLLGAGEYRQATYYGGESDWSAVMDIDLEKNWDKLMSEGGPEFTNLVYMMNFKAKSPEFDYGLSHWNNLVHTFVPAQLMGTAFKQSLFIDLPDYHSKGYIFSPGSTETGMNDAFLSFWYFGFIKFIIIASLMGMIYAAAMRGNAGMQVLYMLSAMPSMLTITHFTNEIVLAWVHIAAFLLPVSIYASWKVRMPRPVETMPPTAQRGAVEA